LALRRRRRSAALAKPARITHTPIASRAQLGFDYTLKQSSRRTTLSLLVKDGVVEVAAPEALPSHEAHSFVASKARWVLTKLQEQRQRLAEVANYCYEEGERFPFLGQSYQLVVGKAPRTQVHLGEAQGLLYVLLGGRSRKPRGEQIKDALQRWYRQQAEVLLGGKTRTMAERLGVIVTDIRWRQTRSKWGHCTRDGVIQYNWLIVQAPEAVVDYLVAHEVCHRVHLNHGKRFWQKVASVCPDYERQRRWLRDNGHRLGL